MIKIEEDLKFQRRVWRAQRAGWILLAAILLAALVGAFGFGGVSQAEAGQHDADLWIEYERYARRMAPTEVKAHCRPGTDAKFELALSAEYLEAVEVQRITPEPEAAEITETETRYIFRGAPGGQTTVNLEIQPRRAGRARGAMRSGSGKVHFQQLVYP